MAVTIIGVFRRRVDLLDETPQNITNPQTFARIRVSAPRPPPWDPSLTRVEREQGPTAVGPLGLVNSMEWHRTLRGQRALVHFADKGERALLVQTTANCALIQDYASTHADLFKNPLGDLAPGSFAEQLCLDGGADFHSGALCIGDEWVVEREGAVVLRYVPEVAFLLARHSAPRFFLHATHSTADCSARARVGHAATWTTCTAERTACTAPGRTVRAQGGAAPSSVCSARGVRSWRATPCGSQHGRTRHGARAACPSSSTAATRP
jgi:hypothetical protein